jgi:hypothetical protein
MTDLIDVLVEDHRRVETLFVELETEPGDTELGDPGHRGDIVDVVIAELVGHAVAEELYLYPTVRDLLPDGGHVADRELRQHADLQRTMDALDPADPGTLAALIAAARDHIAEQERDLFPRLRRTCPADRLESLGRRAEAAKRIAPTRPHPHAPVNRLVTPGTGLVDRVRDAITNRPTHVDDL